MHGQSIVVSSALYKKIFSPSSRRTSRNREKQTLSPRADIFAWYDYKQIEDYGVKLFNLLSLGTATQASR